MGGKDKGFVYLTENLCRGFHSFERRVLGLGKKDSDVLQVLFLFYCGKKKLLLLVLPTTNKSRLY